MIPMPGSYQPYADWRKVDFGMSFGVIAVDAATLADTRSHRTDDSKIYHVGAQHVGTRRYDAAVSG